MDPLAAAPSPPAPPDGGQAEPAGEQLLEAKAEIEAERESAPASGAEQAVVGP
jgi:hypothetical protein